METKRIKLFFALGGIVALLAIMLFAAVTFADNLKKEADVKATSEVQKIESKSTSEKINADSYKMTIKLNGISQGITLRKTVEAGKEEKIETIYYLTNKDLVLDLPSSIDNYIVVLNKQDYGLSIKFSAQKEEPSWNFSLYGQIGYGVEKIAFDQNQGIPLTNDSVLTVTGKEVTGGATIQGYFCKRVSEEVSEPLGGAKIIYYDKKGNVIAEKTTDNSSDPEKKGTFTISGLTKEQCNGNIYAEGPDGYSDSFRVIKEEDFRDSKYDGFNLKSESLAIKLDPSENIKLFKLYYKEYNDGEYEIEEAFMPRCYFPMNGESSNASADLQFSIESDGTAICDAYVDVLGEKLLYEEYKFSPLYEEGYVFDYWTLNGKNYGVGKIEDLGDLSKGLIGTVYSKVPGDDPTPTPTPVTPTSDVTSGNKTSISAKTGDAFPVGIIIGLIGIAGASAFIVRKRIKK